MKHCRIDGTPKERKALQQLAREQLKLKLLQDIRIDIMICQLEGWDYKEYINELKELINSFGKESEK